MKIMSLVGARPQFVKEAMISAAVRQSGAWEHKIVHSGQHYDVNMSEVFFKQLGIPAPAYHLNIGSGSHAGMTGAALSKAEEVLLLEKPDALIVYGDTNTTLAGALAASKISLPVIHVEAGLRQKPLTMPEEINRRLTDHAAMLSGGVLACCSQKGRENLAAENITDGVTVAGDVMFDIFRHMQPGFDPDAACKQYSLKANDFFLLTLHRDFNVDASEKLCGIMAGIANVAKLSGKQVLFPVHPRTRARLEALGISSGSHGLILIEPLGYIELMSLVTASAAVITDSGGLQKEAFYAGKRAVVIMPDTCWPELVESGWNVLAAPEKDSISSAVQMVMEPVNIPPCPYGDGAAAQRIVEAVLARLGR